MLVWALMLESEIILSSKFILFLYANGFLFSNIVVILITFNEIFNYKTRLHIASVTHSDYKFNFNSIIIPIFVGLINSFINGVFK